MRRKSIIGGRERHSADIEKWLAVIRADEVGPKAFARLLKYFGSLDGVLGASVSELTRIEQIGDRKAERIAASFGKFDVAKELALADKLGVWIVHAADKRYPPALKAIYDPPPVLYVKGTLERSDSLAVAIVGSRRCSTYGAEQASRFGHMLASAGFTIISGMARGIDTAAHRGALTACGRTVAVQGCGLANVFPPENDKLFEHIAQSGACVSELSLQDEPLSSNFPGRNRIIAGLAMAVLVVEASGRSGALITARAAMDNNREVMAIPGKVDSPISTGAHRLIKDGARLVDCVEDVMETLGRIGQGLKDHVGKAAKEAQAKMDLPLFDVSRLNLSDDERTVYESLDGEPKHIEEIIALTNLAAGAVNATVISLRLKGLLKQLPGNLFMRK